MAKDSTCKDIPYYRLDILISAGVITVIRFSFVSPNEMLALQEIVRTAEGLSLDKRPGIHDLYEKYHILRFCVCAHKRIHALMCLYGSEFLHRKWSTVLSPNPTSLYIMNVQNLLHTEFIIITSNAALERMLYKQTWADCRNPLNINSIKAKLQIQINLIMIFSFLLLSFCLFTCS